MASLGLVQFLLGNGKFLWVFEHPSRDTFRAVKGPFQNQNHFAHFLALGIGPILWLLCHTATRSAVKHALAVGLGIVAIAGLLTFSRGGVIAIVSAAIVCAGVYSWHSILGRRSLITAGSLGILVAATLCIHGYQPLATRLATLRDSRSLEELCHGREALYTALAEGIPNFAVLGSGVGSHRDVYPMFMEKHFDIEFTHGENGYLPLLLEAGAPGLVLVLIGIGICFFWCLRILFSRPSPKKQGMGSFGGRQQVGSWSSRGAAARPDMVTLVACSGAILPAMVASVVQSVGDFVWYISACMSVTIILAACACRLYQIGRTVKVNDGGKTDHRTSLNETAAPGTEAGRCSAASARRGFRRKFRTGQSTVFPRPAWLAVAIVVTAMGLAMVNDRRGPALAAPHWYRYKKIALDTDVGKTLEETEERDLLAVLAQHLDKALECYPNDPRVNLRAAGVCLRRFELEQQNALNPMALDQIRDAALASQFPSKEAQDEWLAVATGENRYRLHQALSQCRRGLQGCPLQGEGYVYLADLSFLEGPQNEAKHAYIAQAQKVRPHSGLVLFASGQEAALAGDLVGALQLWKRAFDQDPEIRTLIIESYADKMPAGYFLSAFEPETGGLSRLFRHYHRLNRVQDARVVAAQYVKAVERDVRSAEDRQASDLWFQARDAHVLLGARDQALACVQRAVELDPTHFDKRLSLAQLSVENGRFADAVQQFQWCLRRKPHDDRLNQQLADAKRHSLQQSSSSAALPVGQDRRRF